MQRCNLNNIHLNPAELPTSRVIYDVLIKVYRKFVFELIKGFCQPAIAGYRLFQRAAPL